MLPFILALVTALHPQATRTGDAGAISRAIAEVVASEDPLPNMTRERTAALLVVTAWDETRFNMAAVGDHGRSFCAMQIQNKPWTAKSPRGCVSTALRILRVSMAACPDAPLAGYAGSCASPAARAISADRLKRSALLEQKAKLAIGEPPAVTAAVER